MSNDTGNYILRTNQFGIVAGTCNYFDIVKFADERLPKNYCKELLEIKVQLKEFCINSDEQYRNILEETDSFHNSA